MTNPFRWRRFGFIGALMFAVGVLVGQQAQRPKFDSYLTPRSVSDLQMQLIDTDLELIRDHLPSVDGFFVPAVGYDARRSCFWGKVRVSPALLKEPADSVRDKLLGEALMTRDILRSRFPKISEAKRNADPDFRMSFFQIENGFSTVAEYTDGKILLK